MDIFMESKISDKILGFIKEQKQLFESFDAVYLFGSVLDRDKYPRDIDLLLVYSEYSNKIINDLDLICYVLEEIFKIPIDLTVLDCAELTDTDFLKKIKVYIKLK